MFTLTIYLLHETRGNACHRRDYGCVCGTNILLSADSHKG
jgi:hypothetical protein